jgi:NADH dehydrogenase
MTDTTKVVIVGGGFAGLNLAKKLGRQKGYTVTMIDKNNYNYFTPLLYQVATGFLDVSNISYPFRTLFRTKVDKNPKIGFRLAELLRVDPKARTCYLSNGEISYDYLIFATGTMTNYFGNENIRRNAIPMKNIEDALKMRNILLQHLEMASRSLDAEEKKRLLTFVVAGGGPTGVEVAGMLAELRKSMIRAEYPELRGVQSEIYLVEGGANLLAQMSKKSQRESYNALVKLGVRIRLNAFVTDYQNSEVTLSNHTGIQTKNLIWAAGVIAPVFEGIPKTSLGPGNRIVTDAYNQVKDLEDVYAIGDSCIQYTDPRFPKGHPQLAQVAIQQGRFLARNLRAVSEGKPLTHFRYVDKGTLAIIGRKKAVADLFGSGIHVGGFPAIIIWLFVHLSSLIKFRNKAKTLYNWTIAYLTGDQSLRIIY